MNIRVVVSPNLKVWPKPPAQPEKSIDLLQTALEGGDTTRELSRKLGMNSNALNVARHRGRLSPTAAGALATYIGHDTALWTAIAALEAEPPSEQQRSLLTKLLAKARNS